MHALIRSALMASTIAIISPAAAATAKAPMAKPHIVKMPLARMPVASARWNGTWRLNVSHSKLSTPKGKRSETRIYAVQGNRLTFSSTGTDPSGKPTKSSYSGILDGKRYPMVGSPLGNNIAIRVVNPNRLHITVRMGKVITGITRSEISRDGRHMRLIRTTAHAKAKPTVDVLMFDKK